MRWDIAFCLTFGTSVSSGMSHRVPTVRISRLITLGFSGSGTSRDIVRHPVLSRFRRPGHMGHGPLGRVPMSRLRDRPQFVSLNQRAGPSGGRGVGGTLSRSISLREIK